MVADSTADNNLVSCCDFFKSKLHTRQSHAEACRIYKNPVGVTGFNNLGIASNYFDVVFLCGLADTVQNFSEQLDFKPRLDYHCQRKSNRP